MKRKKIILSGSKTSAPFWFPKSKHLVVVTYRATKNQFLCYNYSVQCRMQLTAE